MEIEFDFDLIINCRFMEGDCDLLAHNLQKSIGGSIYCIFRSSRLNINSVNYNDPEHFVLKLNGKYIDINGIWTKKGLLNY